MHRSMREAASAEQISKEFLSAVDGVLCLPIDRRRWLVLATQLGVARGTMRAAYERPIDAQLICFYGPERVSRNGPHRLYWHRRRRTQIQPSRCIGSSVSVLRRFGVPAFRRSLRLGFDFLSLPASAQVWHWCFALSVSRRRVRTNRSPPRRSSSPMLCGQLCRARCAVTHRSPGAFQAP